MNTVEIILIGLALYLLYIYYNPYTIENFDNGLNPSTGSTTWIIIGVVAFLIIIGGSIFLYWRNKKEKKMEEALNKEWKNQRI